MEFKERLDHGLGLESLVLGMVDGLGLGTLDPAPFFLLEKRLRAHISG